MGLHHFPFMAVTVIALFVHVVSATATMLLQPVWKGDTILYRWRQPARAIRFFSVKRTDVRKPITWGCIVVARAALIAAALSFVLDLFIN